MKHDELCEMGQPANFGRDRFSIYDCHCAARTYSKDPLVEDERSATNQPLIWGWTEL